jgi:hypothetical protein
MPDGRWLIMGTEFGQRFTFNLIWIRNIACYCFCVYYIQLGTLYFFQDEDLGKSEYLGRPGAIVSNHVSHLDILYHMSSSLPSFVAKVQQLCCNVDFIHLVSQELCPQKSECVDFDMLVFAHDGCPH